MAPSSVQRICNAQTGTTVDGLEKLAGALGVSVTKLLEPSESMRRTLNLARER